MKDLQKSQNEKGDKIFVMHMPFFDLLYYDYFLIDFTDCEDNITLREATISYRGAKHNSKIKPIYDIYRVKSYQQGPHILLEDPVKMIYELIQKELPEFKDDHSVLDLIIIRVNLDFGPMYYIHIYAKTIKDASI